MARDEKLPPDLVPVLDLARGERALAAAPLVAGGWAVATTLRLVLLDESGTAGATAWTDVAAGTMNGDDGVLDVERIDGTHAGLLLGVGQGRRFAEALRERVQRTVLLTRLVPAPNRRQVRVVARRFPDDHVEIQVIADRGVDLDRPELAAEVAAAVAALRDQVGLPPV